MMSSLRVKKESSKTSMTTNLCNYNQAEAGGWDKIYCNISPYAC